MTKIKFWILSKYAYCQTMQLELSLFFFLLVNLGRFSSPTKVKSMVI